MPILSEPTDGYRFDDFFVPIDSSGTTSVDSGVAGLRGHWPQLLMSPFDVWIALEIVWRIRPTNHQQAAATVNTAAHVCQSTRSNHSNMPTAPQPIRLPIW